MSSPRVPSHADPDTERTAELPVLDPAAAHAGEHRASQTDTLILPALAAPPTEASAPAAHAGEHRASQNDTLILPALAAPPTEASAPAAHAGEHRMSQTDTWIAPPPPARQTELAQQALSAKLREMQELSAMLRESQELLAAKGARLTQAERARDEAYAARAAAEQRAAQLNTELAQVRAELAFQLDELTRSRAQFEEHLAQARALLSTASARADQLQRQLEEQESATRAQRAQELEQRQVAAQDRTRAAGVLSDLHRERERALAYFESLQSAEGRRLILEGLASDLQRQADERERELARVGHALAGRDAQARELQAELARRAARITRLEQQESAFGTALAQRDTQLRETRQEMQGLQESVTALRARLAAGSERLRTLQASAEAHGSSNTQQQAELARLQAERANLTAAVESARAATLAANEQAAGRGAALEHMRSRNAELEATLTAERRRVGQLEEELATARRDTQDWGSALSGAQQERNAHLASLGAAEARVRELEERVAEQLEAARALQADADTSAARARELEGDLRAAEDAVNRLESEARARNARIEELEKANHQWRTTLEEARHTATDTAANQGLRDAAHEVADTPAAPEPVPDAAARLLIHTEEGREVVHVLGRRTSIGRTPDNDLQIDAKFISRHHAVILVGPVHSIIEDLNSTNGVYVNGRRITRNTLKDGDTLLFGRAQYRFAVRRSGDKR
jgi:chromosome segregation ATPase